MQANFPAKLDFLFKPSRYKVPWGGRGGAKSWGVSRALIIIGANPEVLWPGRTEGPRILCARETQKSITDSVHKLLTDQIKALGLEGFYRVEKSRIYGRNGTEFIFAGIRQNVGNIKSYEACDICWVEEAQNVSKHSWEILIPTIRKEQSEIWATFNPELETDDTYQRFVVQPPANSSVIKVNWSDNPWFPDVLRQEKDELQRRDPDAYEHVWEGMCKQVVEGAVFRAELIAADKDERIGSVRYDPIQPVHTYWDIGYGDNTAIWFAQSVGSEFRLIDYLDGSQQALGYYIREIRNRPYIYGSHYLPHDAKAHEYSTGRTIEEQAKSLGLAVKIVPRTATADQIAAARAVFGRCYFDKEKCADGLQSLRHYRFVFDEHLLTLQKEPLHDWSSHASKAFMYFALTIREPAKQKEAMKRKLATRVSAWS